MKATLDWRSCPLSSVCKSEEDIRCGPFGTQLQKSEFLESGVPLWGIKQVNKFFAELPKEFLHPTTASRLGPYSIEAGDLVMTRKGTVGNCAVFPSSKPVGIMHSDLLRIRVNPETCDPNFLTYQLRHSPDVARQLALISGGAIMPGINVGKLKSLLVRVPPLPEQRRIADILDRAEALRAKRRDALTLLDELKRSLFREMFGDPVANPKGFNAGTIDDVVGAGKGDVRCGPFGTQLKVHEIVSQGIPLLGIENVLNNKFVEQSTKFLTPAKARELTAFDVKPNDVLITRMGTIGRACVVPPTFEEGRFSYHLFRIRPDQTKCLSAFLSGTISDSGTFQSQLQSMSHGAIMAGLNTTDLRRVKFLIPPLPLQQEFARRVQAIDQLKAKHRQSLAEMDALFLSLQHRAFRGEL